MGAQGARHALPVTPAGVEPVTAVDVVEIGGALTRGLEWLGAAVDVAAGLLTVRNLVLVLAAASVLLVGWVLLKTVATRRALRPERRVRLLVLPTETFDPSGEEVERFAAQLSRARRSVAGSLDRPAQAVRLRLDAIGTGRCVFGIEGSARAESVLRLAGYGEVELRPADAVDIDALGCLDRPGPSAGDAGGVAQPDDERTTARQRERVGGDDKVPAGAAHGEPGEELV